jgi:hypothetical protein
MTKADDAYTAARAAIMRVQKAGETKLDLSGEEFRALDRLSGEIAGFGTLQTLRLDNTQVADLAPLAGLTALDWLTLDDTQVTDLAPLAGLSALRSLWLNRTQVADLAPIADLSALQSLWLNGTQVANLTPLAGLTALQTLNLDDTQVADLAPLAGLTALEWLTLDDTQVADITPLAGLTVLRSLWLNNTQVTDLRRLRDMTELGKGDRAGLWFHDTPALRDPELARLSEIEDDYIRSRDTLAYLQTLPPWPAPLPWEVAQAEEAAPTPDPALPLILVNGQIDLQTTPLTAEEAHDPLRASLFADLQDRLDDLIRVSANQDDGIYREACRLRALLDAGLAGMDAVRVHLAIEALRRKSKALPDHTDPDLVHAIAPILEIGPGLTLGTPEVETLLRRIRDNQLIQKASAEIEAEIRIATQIANSPMSAEGLIPLAQAAAQPDIDDQLSALRTPLVRNYTTIAAVYWIADASLQGVAGNATYDALRWLVANADDILIIARYWGEPVLAWITPILHRAQEITKGAGHITNKFGGPS